MLAQGIDTTTTLGGTLAFHILTVMAEFERDIISQRTREGLAAARSRGRKGCRRPVLTETQLTGAREMCDSNRYTFQQIADAVGCSRITLYRALSRTSGAAA